jgi:hypothetical protein
LSERNPPFAEFAPAVLFASGAVYFFTAIAMIAFTGIMRLLDFEMYRSMEILVASACYDEGPIGAFTDGLDAGRGAQFPPGEYWTTVLALAAIAFGYIWLYVGMYRTLIYWHPTRLHWTLAVLLSGIGWVFSILTGTVSASAFRHFLPNCG